MINNLQSKNSPFQLFIAWSQMIEDSIYNTYHSITIRTSIIIITLPLKKFVSSADHQEVIQNYRNNFDSFSLFSRDKLYTAAAKDLRPWFGSYQHLRNNQFEELYIQRIRKIEDKIPVCEGQQTNRQQKIMSLSYWFQCTETQNTKSQHQKIIKIMNVSWSKLLVVLLVTFAVYSIELDLNHEEKIGLLCYDKCPSGYTRLGFDCHQNCPTGFRNNGLFCRAAEYGRGAGYPWKFRDGFNNHGQIKRCEDANGKGNCEVWGALVYPKCKSGFHSFGCCICRPSKPDCEALGLNKGIDLSCAKKIIIGKPHKC